MSRFYVPPENIGKKKITITADEARHILDVMRLDIGDSVVVFDGLGMEYSGSIAETDRRAKTVTVEITSSKKFAEELLPNITLAQAVPKKEKMDYIVEKATELGVSAIIPLVTARTVTRPDEDGRDKKAVRWRKIAQEAAKQCGRADIPEIKEILKFSDVISGIGAYDLAMFACLFDDTISLKAAISGFKGKKIIVFIGPEGDFTPEEINTARAAGYKFVSLGKRVLKSDTAGLFALSAINYEFTS